MKTGTTAALLAAALLTGACATGPSGGPAPAAAQPSAPPGPRPTVVLVAGAFEESASWDKVIRGLRADGFPVLAPAVPLRGVASDTDALEGVLDSVRGRKILVGHSYGGLLTSALAGRTPDVAALVYVSAFIPRAGETAGGLNAQFPGTLIGPATTHAVPSPAGPELYVNAADFAEIFGGAPADAEVDAATQRPVLAAAFDEKVTTDPPAEIPKFAIVATEDKAIPPAAARFQARRAGASITEVRAPHAVPATHPEAVLEVIRRAAAETR